MEEATAVKKRRGQRGLGHMYEHRKNWWVAVWIGGKRHRWKIAPVKIMEKRDARKLADERIGKFMAMPKPVEQKGTMTFREYARRFADHYVATRRSWRKNAGRPLEKTQLQHCVRRFGDTPLKDITQQAVEEFRAHLARLTVGKYLKKPMTVTTVNKNISLLRAVFYRAMREGCAAHNPVAELPKGEKLRKETATAGRILEREEEPRLLTQLPPWLRLLAMFCLQTATRRGDLVHLTWKAVHPEYVEFLETKECKKRTIRLSRDARAILDMLRPEKADPDGYVFEPGTERIALEWKIARAWDKAVQRAGIPHVRFHDLRHTAATRLVNNGVELQTVQKILGHASLSTTQRYLHSSDKQQQCAVDTLSGDYGRYLASGAENSVAENAVPARIQ